MCVFFVDAPMIPAAQRLSPKMGVSDAGKDCPVFFRLTTSLFSKPPCNHIIPNRNQSVHSCDKFPLPIFQTWEKCMCVF